VRCPYRIVDQATGREIDWINQYLDYEMLRRLADTTLRTYAHELLHFLRWWEGVHHTDVVTKDALTQTTLLEYVRFQSGQERELTGATINQRVAIVDRALRITFPDAPHQAANQLLDHYLRLERPQTSTNALFVSLKGPARGTRMTPAGLRSVFRHHRRTTGVKMANPHRFRHTFASDMVRAGVSLPALMQLMGHAQIQTTLVYMQVTPLEVYQQYARAVAQLIRPVPVTPP
jgi:site-specific recombinase XerD